MTNIDVTLICGRRPTLLGQTLESFSEKLFKNFKINRVVVNIDPFGGDVSDHAKCISLIRAKFPSATITEPQSPSFGMAVKTAWSQTEEDIVFHLEDDWLLLEPLTPADIFPLFESNTKAVQLVSKEMQWDGAMFKVHHKPMRFLGVRYGTRDLNIFGTSPGFWSGSAMRECATLMDPTLDPEKQMRPHFNPPMWSFLQSCRCRVLPSKAGGELIRDIGRIWRETEGIKKQVVNGKSIWSDIKGEI